MVLALFDKAFIVAHSAELTRLNYRTRIRTCLGVTETVGLDIKTRRVQDYLSDFLRIRFLVHSLRGQDLVATLSKYMGTQLGNEQKRQMNRL